MRGRFFLFTKEPRKTKASPLNIPVCEEVRPDDVGGEAEIGRRVDPVIAE